MQTTDKYRKGIITAIIATAAVSTLPVFIKLGLRGELHPFVILFYRFFFASCLLFLFLAVSGRGKLIIARPNLLKVFSIALLLNIPSSTCFSFALVYIDAFKAILLLYLHPLFLIILESVLYRKRLSFNRILVCFIVLAGCGLILFHSGNSHTNIMGVILAVLAAFILAVYLLVTQKALASVNPETFSFYLFLGNALGYAGLILLTNKHFSMDFNTYQWIIISGIAVIPTLIALYATVKAISLVGAVLASIISYLEPVFTVIFSVFILKESLSAIQLAGAVIVISGIILFTKADNKSSSARNGAENHRLQG